jgi:hypothetical protein
VKKRVLAIVLTAVLVLSLGLVFATPAGANPGTATFGDDPSDWKKTENRITSATTELGSAAAWDDTAWGDWVTPAWDGPSSGIHGDTISYWVANDTWVMWSNGGDNWVDHTDQWFRTSIDIPYDWIVTSAKLVYKYNNNIIPVNDDLYVYVDDEYVAAGGTAGVGWVQGYLPMGVTPPPDPTYGSNTFVAAIDPYSYAIAPETGWYLNGGLDLPPELFSPGSHDLHVLGEEFDISGGLGHLIIQVEYEESIEVSIDIKPTSCPNPINFKSRGVLPVAILGTEDFDVTEIDPATVMLEGIAPLRWSIEDVATPYDGEITAGCCECCTTEGPDGFPDLTLKFSTPEIVAALEGARFNVDKECFILQLTGELTDGTAIEGNDIVKIINKTQNGGF